ncbi:MAG: hypothetical protein JJU13_18605 [Balneolaceae bacterium]|nr:hypothetical protein [Balneolaceae bacterium]
MSKIKRWVKSSEEFFKKYTNVDDWDDPGTTRLMTLSHFYSFVSTERSDSRETKPAKFFYLKSSNFEISEKFRKETLRVLPYNTGDSFIR